MTKKIIVPIDGSAISIRALQFGIHLAKALGDEIRVVHVQPMLEVLGENIIKEATEILEEADVPFTTTIRIGTPSLEIIAEAKEDNVRCIIMGTKGSGNATGEIGSVSQATLAMTPCPITFIPEM